MRPPVIIGGGPAGVAAALTLRAANQPVCLIERHAEPTDRLCGDFLAGVAVSMARGFGLSFEALDARPIHALRLIRHARAYETALPFNAFSLSRRRFDSALRALCHQSGVSVILGAIARPPRVDRDDILIETDTGLSWLTGTALLATGRPVSAAPVSAGSGWVIGWKHYLRLTTDQHAALTGAVEIVPLAGTRVALTQVEGDEASLCVLSRDPDLPTTWPALREKLGAASAHLRRRLDGAQAARGAPLWSRDLSFRLSNRPRGGDHDGLYVLGDQAGLAAGLLADGVSAALRGGARAARAVLGGTGAADYHNGLRAMLWPRTRYSVTFDPAERVVGRGKFPVADSIHAEWARLIA
jgi:2-polyprenyl-6-methoxyphenol hydroxylase-like FAD-dependent oxidoreductase